MAAFTAFPEAAPVSEYQLTYRTSEDGVVTMRMPVNGATPTRVAQRKDGYWYSYSPDGKYIAMVVADLENAVVSTARLAAMAAGSKVGEGVAPDAVASASGGTLHPATPRWVEIIDAQTFQTLHKLENVSGIEEYFYWSPRSRYIVTWQPLTPSTTTASSSSLYGSSSAPSSNTSSSSSGPSVADSPNLKVWDVLTGKVVMHFKHGQRQGWPIVRWTDDEKIAARWASGQIHLYHWAKASFHLSPEDNFAAMTRETIDKQGVWDWSVARSALAIFTKEVSTNNTPAHVHLYPLNTSLGEDPSKSTDSMYSNDLSSSGSIVASNVSPTTSSAPSTPAKKSAAAPQQQQQQQQPGSGKKGRGQQQKNVKGGLPPLNSAPPKEPANLTTIIEPAGVAPKSKPATSATTTAASPSPPPATPAAEEESAQDKASAAKPTPVNQLTTLAPSDPVCSKSFYNCDDVAFHWHNRGQALLVFATTQRDKSGANNYYGNTYLYYLPADGKGECDVTTDKKGPIHDVRWNAKGNDFAVTYGEYPSKTALYNRKCKALGHLGTESRNKLVWSPQGRVLMSGGFGQLPGNFDIWDTVSLTKLGSSASFTSGHHEWSPDGKFLLTAALWPRMRVDNFFSLFDLKANLIHYEPLSEVWKVCWRPMPGCASAYPTSPQEAIVVAPPAQTASIPKRSALGRPAASSEPYRPPGAKRAATSQFAQSQIPVKEAREAPERFVPLNAPKPTAAPAPVATAAPSKVPIGGAPKKSNSPIPASGARSNNNSRSPGNRSGSGRY